MNEYWKRKLGSRKFWALLGAIGVSLLLALGAGDDTVSKVTSVVTAVGACVCYMLAEAKVDAAGKRPVEADEADG